MVAIVENLDKVSSSLESGEKDKLTWIQANAEYLKQNGGQIFYANFPGKLSECVDKSQMYLFDRNYHLQETLLADWKKFEQQNILKKVENVDTSTVEEAGELEQKLASVEEYLRVNHDKNWQAMFNSYLGITVTGIPRDKLTSILNEFTKDRRDRYKSILKLS